MKHAAFLLFITLASLTACGTLRSPVETPDHDRSGEDINGDFPEAVYIKTRTQTFNTYHYYILYDGKIWYKDRGGKGESPWTLFQKTGLPQDPWAIGFNAPRRIVEISADADELAALSEEGGFYRFCFDLTIAHKNNVWLDRHGWPVEEQLFLDPRTAKNIAWALGKRNSQVLYYEDPFGNQHHNGAMEIATTYMLLEDGQEICYADTGLRSDFSRNYLGPERGAFKAVALSASASTMFVMNEAGEMYTRIADFDITGCDPMWFKYTYIPYTSELPGTNYFSNLTEWGLPSEDWRAQPRIPLDGKAALSRHITILQNGQGNGARELRVAGLNEEGETGYWTKAIFAGDWTFRAVPLYFSPGSLLPNTGRPGARGKTLDAAFSGYWWKGTEKEGGVVYEIPDFNILEGSCQLRITRGAEVCQATLYPVELWTYHKRDFLPGRTGRPKMFLLTLSFEKNALTGLSNNFAAFIRKRFLKNDKKLFHYTLTAKNNFCLIRDSDQGDSLIFLADGTIPDNFLEFNKTGYVNFEQETARYNSAELCIKTQQLNAHDIRGKIFLNKKFQDQLKAKIIALEQEKLLAFSVNFGYLPLDGIIRASPLQFVDVPKIYTMTRFGAKIVLQNSSDTWFFANIEGWVYQKFIDLLDLRIACYTELAKDLGRRREAVSLPPWYTEDLGGYWNLGGFPRAIQGSFFSPQIHRKEELPAVLTLRLPETAEPAFGWYLAAGASPSHTLFIDPGQSARTIYKRRGKSPAEQPLVIDCTLYINPASFTGPEKTIVEQSLKPFVFPNQEGIKARIIFDGENFEIQEYPAAHSNKTIFRGRAVL